MPLGMVGKDSKKLYGWKKESKVVAHLLKHLSSKNPNRVFFDELKPGFSNKTGTTSRRKQSGSNQDYEETFIGPAATFERKGHTGLGRSLLPVRCFDSFSVTTQTGVAPVEPLQVMSDDKDRNMES